MAEIATRRGETLTQKHARLEAEHLTPRERVFIEAEAEVDFARSRWQQSDHRTKESRALRDRLERAQAKLDRAVELLDVADRSQ